jgi:dinuclear metal center YbgI/SA1388 family protein
VQVSESRGSASRGRQARAEPGRSRPPAAPLALRDVLAVLDRLYPPASAMDWDRVGLVTGDLGQPVRTVHFAVDPTLAVVQEAVDAHADLLVTHHPLLLRGVHSVATSTAKGAAVTTAVVGDLAIFCAHTNADVAEPGVCDALAAACALEMVGPLTTDDRYAVGRVGSLPTPLSLRAFVEALATRLPATAGGIRVAGPAGATVQRVAVVGGAGDDWFDAVRAAEVDVYVTADLRHHPALEAREESRGGPPYLVDAGHWASEWVWLASAERELLAALGPAGAVGPAGSGRGPGGHEGATVETYVSQLRTEPWDFVVGANADGGMP